MAWKTVRIACLRLEYELTILRELEADAQRVDRVFVKPHRRGERAGQGVTLTHGEAPLHGYLESRRGESRLSLTNVRTAPVRRTEAVLLLHFRPALERVETGSRESIPKVPMCSYSTLARDQSPRIFLVRTDLSLESYHPLFSFIGDGIWLLWSVMQLPGTLNAENVATSLNACVCPDDRWSGICLAHDAEWEGMMMRRRSGCWSC